jgi:hypothetical protein
MSECPRCGEEVNEGEAYCRNCGLKLGSEKGEWRSGRIEERVGASDHLSIAWKIVTDKPMVFVPTLISGVMFLIASVAFGGGLFLWTRGRESAFYGPMAFGGLLFIVGLIISYILTFASLDMSRDAYLNESLDLGGSVSYVLGRIGTFILASIVGAILSITVILIPVVIFMFVIITIDETGFMDALSKAVRVIGRDLRDVIIVIIVAIVGSIVLGIIPFIGGLLTAALNVIIGLAFIDIYFQYKRRGYT